MKSVVSKISCPEKLSDEIYVMKSVFENRPDTVFFPYGVEDVCVPEAGRIRAMTSEEIETALLSIAYNHKHGNPHYTQALRRAGFSLFKSWRRTEIEGGWNKATKELLFQVMDDDPNFNVYNLRNKKTSLRQIKNVNKY